MEIIDTSIQALIKSKKEAISKLEDILEKTVDPIESCRIARCISYKKETIQWLYWELEHDIVKPKSSS